MILLKTGRSMTDEAQPPLSVARQFDAICDEFETELQSGKSPRIEDFLTRVDLEHQRELLLLLLRLEIELRARDEDQKELNSLQERFPDCAGLINTVCPARDSKSAEPPNSDGTVANGSPSAETSISPGTTERDQGAPWAEGDVFDRFTIRGVLGKGAFGTVYRAHDPQLDRDVAIKIPQVGALISSEEAERFQREAQSAATIRHPNVCPVYEVNELNGQPYIVMAFIDGKPLSALIRKGKRLTQRQAAHVVRKLARGLAKAHKRGVIHRDLKPDNIILDRDSREPVITDFGLARREQAEDVQLTQVGQIMGTPAYMSPEQARADTANIKEATDIYSLGVILYELLCGRRPYSGSVAEILAGILSEETPPPSNHKSDIDPQLQEICLRAIAKNPHDRFPSMKEFADALGAWQKGADVQTINVSYPADMFDDSVESTNQWASAGPSTDTSRDAAVDARKTSRRWRDVWSSISPMVKILSCAAAAAMLIFGIIVYLDTDRGTLKIEVLDPQLTVQVAGNTITADNDGRPIRLEVGTHKITVTFDGLEIPFEDTFDVTKDNHVVLRVTLYEGDIALLDPDDELPPTSTGARNGVDDIPLKAVSAVAGTTIWNDDFESDSLDKYRNTRYWRIHDGVLQPIANPSGESQPRLLLPFTISGDVVAEFTIVPRGRQRRNANFSIGDATCIVGGNRNRQSWMCLHLFPDHSISTRRVSRVGIPEGRKTHVRMTRMQNTVSFFVDGILIGTYRLPEDVVQRPAILGFSRHLIGLSVSFENLTVRRPTVEEYAAAGINPPVQDDDTDRDHSAALATDRDAELAKLRARVDEYSDRPADEDDVVRLRQELEAFRLNHYGTDAVSSACRYVAVGTWDPHELLVRNIQTGQELFRVRHPIREVRRLSYSPDGRCLITSTTPSKSLFVWNAETGEPVDTLVAHSGNPPSFQFSADGTYLATLTNSPDELKIWNFEQRQVVKELINATLRERIDEWSFPRFSPDGRTLMVNAKSSHRGGRSYVLLWDTQTWSLQRILEHCHLNIDYADFANLFWCNDGRHIIRANRNGTFFYFRLSEMKEVAEVPVPVPELVPGSQTVELQKNVPTTSLSPALRS